MSAPRLIGDPMTGHDAHTRQPVAGVVEGVIPCGSYETRYLLRLTAPITDEHGGRDLSVTVVRHTKAVR